MAEAGLELISQPIAVAAQPGIPAGQFPGPVASLVLAAGRGHADAGRVARLGGDVAEVPPEGGVAQPEAACQASTLGLAPPAAAWASMFVITSAAGPAWTPRCAWHRPVPASRCCTSPRPRCPRPRTAPTSACSAAGLPATTPARASPRWPPHPASCSAPPADAAAPCDRLERHGHLEREAVTAATGADLLILARDGDRSRLGPKGLGKVTRFVVDHAPCPVLLVWPEPAPGITTIPPPPPRPPGHGPHNRP
jgi:Universal stress protein family